MDEKPQDQMFVEYKTGNESTISGAGNDAALAMSVEEFSKRERTVLWKLDCFIAPVMMLLMLISYLDRGNVRLSCSFLLSVSRCFS